MVQLYFVEGSRNRGSVLILLLVNFCVSIHLCFDLLSDREVATSNEHKRPNLLQWHSLLATCSIIVCDILMASHNSLVSIGLER